MSNPVSLKAMAESKTDGFNLREEGPASAFLALGGTEQELHAFAALLKEKGKL